MSSRGNDVPVTIVGAGPTGVMLAIELARRGIAVRVLDKQPSRPQESRAIGIHAGSLEVFHQLGLIDEFLASGHRLDGLLVHSRARRNTHVRLGGLDSPYPHMLTLSQEVTQRILDEHLDRLGVAVERGVQVTDLCDVDGGVGMTLKRGDDQPDETFTADWVVGCDGAHSIVRRSLGVPFAGEDYAQDWLMAEVAHEWPMRRDHFHIFTYTGAPLVMFPLPSDRWRVFLPMVPGRSHDGAPDMDEIERLAALRGPAGMKLSDPTLLATFRCYRRSTPSMRHGRLLLAGDAAHIHSPAGGQGLNTGLQDAFNLGWKLALVGCGEASPALLDTYSAERVPIAAGVLEFTHRLVRIFTIQSPRRRWLRDRVLPTVMAMPGAESRYARRLSQLGHSYRGGPLASIAPIDRNRPLLAGDRVPCVTGLRRAGKTVSTLDLLATPSHTVLVLAGEPANMLLGERAITRLSRYPSVQTVLVTRSTDSSDSSVVIDPDLAAHRRYAALSGRLVLVRPDGYLAADAPLDKPEIVERYLLKLARGAAQDDRAAHADERHSELGVQPAGALLG